MIEVQAQLEVIGAHINTSVVSLIVPTGSNLVVVQTAISQAVSNILPAPFTPAKLRRHILEG